MTGPPRVRLTAAFSAFSPFVAFVAFAVAFPVFVAGCSDVGTSTAAEDPLSYELSLLTGGDQRFPAGRRSPEPVRVLAVRPGGGGVAGVRVRFELAGDLTGRLSQPVALTDDSGVAETYLLDPGAGSGSILARSGAQSVSASLTVDLAPGFLELEEGTGAVGVPGLPHPDSVLSAVVKDTDGFPMRGVAVWFAASGSLSAFSDTTDVDGRASVILRRTHLGAGSGAVFAFIVGFEELTATSTRPVLPMAERVVVLSVEGLRLDAVTPAGTPTLYALASSGANVASSTVLPSLSVPAHLSLWSGVSPGVHGIQNDTLRFTPQMTTLNPVFKRARSGGFGTAAWLSEEGPLSGFGELLSCRAAFGLDDLNLIDPLGSAAVSGLEAALANPGLALLFAHIPDADVAGHEFGFTSPEYARVVQDIDGLVADLVAEIDLASTLLVVTSPHGGGGRFGDHLHGSDDPADRDVPLILYGTGVTPGATGQARILDVAPTVLWALGMAPPASYEGRVLLELFQPTTSAETAASSP